MDDPEYISVKEAAAYLSVSKWAVYKWINRGLLTAVTIMGSVRLDRKKFYRWCEINAKRKKRG